MNFERIGEKANSPCISDNILSCSGWSSNTWVLGHTLVFCAQGFNTRVLDNEDSSTALVQAA